MLGTNNEIQKSKMSLSLSTMQPKNEREEKREFEY